MVFAGIAGGRVGGAGCHNAGLYTAGDGEKSSWVALFQDMPGYFAGVFNWQRFPFSSSARTR